MKKIITLLKDYVKSTFDIKLYGSIAVLLTVIISINYTIDLENSIIDKYYGQPIRCLWYFILEYSTYLLTCGIIVLFTDKKNLFRQNGFWFSSIFIFGLMAISRGAYFERLAKGFDKNHDAYVFYFKLLDNLEPFLLIVLPMVIFYWIYDRKKIGHFYGIQTKNVDFKPYLIMFFLMIPPIFLASLTQDFQDDYPKVFNSHFNEFAIHKGYSPVYTFIIFELFYLISFLCVELVYRGFLIYRLENYLGEYVILPMIVVYAVLHFGKPLGETIGSIFGGYALGILALKTKNIYGGIAIHVGVAFLMEFFAFIAHQY